jgi:hypothetical protein
MVTLSLIVAVIAGTALIQVPVAGASADPCAGQNMSHLVTTYSPAAWGDGHVPLRCGSWNANTQRGWGYRKLVAKGRWNVWFDGMIRVTLATPTRLTQAGFSTRFYTAWFNNCDPQYRFVVVVEARNTPHGVVTGVNNAYQDFR